MAFLRFTQQWNSIPDFRGCFNWCVGRNNHSPPAGDEKHRDDDSNSDADKPESKLKTKENGNMPDLVMLSKCVVELLS